MPRSSIVAPVELLAGAGEQAQGRLAGIGTGTRSRCPVEGRGEEDRLRVGIEKDLVRIKAVPGESTLRLGASHRIGVVACAAEDGLGDPAVPDSPGLVAEVIEVVREHGIDQVRFRVEQQRNALRILGVESEVPRRVFLDPGSAQGERSSFRRGPVHHPFLPASALLVNGHLFALSRTQRDLVATLLKFAECRFIDEVEGLAVLF